MIELLKFFAVPGSLTFLAVCLVASFVIRRWFNKAWPFTRLVLCGVLLGYLVLSLPAVANKTISALPSVSSPALDASHRLRLIIFDGDNRRGRVARTLELLKAHPEAELWYLGDDWVIDTLVQSGIPRDRFRTESSQRTTREQVNRTATLVSSSAAQTVVVVSRLQAPRVAALFRKAGVNAAIAASSIDDEPPTSGIGQWIPRYVGLRASRDAIYELVALRYYRYKGWIGPE